MEQITLELNEAKEFVLPEDISERLRPGTKLVVESRRNGTLRVRLDASEVPEDEGPRLVRRGKALIVSGGKLPDDFDWNAFMQEGREAPLHPFEPDP